MLGIHKVLEVLAYSGFFSSLFTALDSLPNLKNNENVWEL